MNPRNNNLSFAKKSCVVATEIALAMMAAPMAFAQTAEKGERIEVTGTRIPSPNIESTSPIAVIGAEDIKFEGVRNVENLLNNLPQVFAAQGSSISNGSSGTATVNLRGLGSNRTLVLVNGKRMPAGSPNGPYAADLNQIPAPLIERVEVLTGGASAVYGSDAVAGVVNFILKDNFEGVQGEVDYGSYYHSQNNPSGIQSVLATRAATNPAQFQVPGDKNNLGASTDASLLIGGNFAGGKGNATVFWGYKKEQPILQKEYDYSECALGATTPYTCGGSSTSYPGRFILNGGSGSSRTVADAAGNTRAFSASLDQFNFAPYNFYQRPSDRYTAHATTHYDINSKMRAYLDLSFHDDHTVAQIAPSGLFGVLATLHGDNPMLSAAWRTDLGLTTAASSHSDVAILRRNIEGGGRQDDIRHTSFRAVGGVKGEVFNNWDYDLYAQSGKVIYQEIYRNDFSVVRAQRALDVVTDPATGAAACRSAVSGDDPACVPYNIFRLGGVTPAALAYLQTPGLKKGHTDQTVQGATLAGDLGNYGLKMPGSKSGVGVAAGVERRVEKLLLDVDTEFDTGDLAGQGGPTHGVGGQYTVKEIFGEVRVPIMEGSRMADLLAVNASYRRSEYSTNVSTDTYGFGAEYAPVRMVKIRGSYQVAVRAANVIELFTPAGLGLFNINAGDPCANAAPAATLTQCARTGVTSAQYGHINDSPAGQYNGLFGGNAALNPEKAKTQTIGVVVQPMRNLSATVDYFHIKIDDLISNLDPNVTLTQCLTNGTLCNLVHRDSAGTLWLLPTGFIEANNQNIGGLKTSGYDISVNYTHPIGAWGSLGFNFAGTYLKELITNNGPGLGEYDCVKFYGGACGTPNPEWRHRLRTTWSTPWNLDGAVTWRHFDSVKHAGLSSNPLLHAATVNANDQELGKRDYIDIAASWAFSKQITVRGGVNNVFDKDPPISSLVGAGFGNGNTYPQVYDALGRKVFAAIVVKW